MTKNLIISMALEAGLGSALKRHEGELRVWIEGADWHDELVRFAEIHEGLFFDAVYEAWHSAGMDVLGGDWNTFASTLEAILARGEK